MVSTRNWSKSKCHGHAQHRKRFTLIFKKVTTLSIGESLHDPMTRRQSRVSNARMVQKRATRWLRATFKNSEPNPPKCIRATGEQWYLSLRGTIFEYAELLYSKDQRTVLRLSKQWSPTSLISYFVLDFGLSYKPTQIPFNPINLGFNQREPQQITALMPVASQSAWHANSGHVGYLALPARRHLWELIGMPSPWIVIIPKKFESISPYNDPD